MGIAQRVLYVRALCGAGHVRPPSGSVMTGSRYRLRLHRGIGLVSPHAGVP